MTEEAFFAGLPLKLSPQQRAAVLATEGPVLLLAVPGSGKTTVLVARLGCLIHCRGVSPREILTVTYTVSAAGDMARRFAALFGEDLARQLSFRTINGLCASIIRTYARRKGVEPFALADGDARLNAVLRDLLLRTGSDYPTEQQIKEARTHITYCKNMMLSEADIHRHTVEGMDFPAVYFEYQDYLRRSRLMDFDDQMVFALRILRREPEILARCRARCRWLCLDEAQDTSKIQHAILALLAGESRNYFLVGDEDQSIYGFRAAWPRALLDFERDWPGARVLLMETNYRSTGAIVSRADAFIQGNRDRHSKHMRTDNQDGAPIRRVSLSDYSRQAAYLLQVAKDCRTSTAVLYRNNDSALPLIDLLEREGAPYVCRQREGFFFTSPIVRDLTDVLTLAYRPDDRERFLRICWKLDLKIKKALLTQLLNRQRPGESVVDCLLSGGGLTGWQIGRVKAFGTHLAKLPQLSSFAALRRIVTYMGYGDYLGEERMDTGRLDVLLALAVQNPEPSRFLGRLEELRDLCAAGGGGADCPFVLSTIHASKGLEYDRVLLVDAAEGVFPARRQADLSPAEARRALEEERRLFYVGVTRARHTLELLTYENKFGEPVQGRFPFVSELLGEPDRPAQAAEVPAAQWELDFAPGTAVVHRRFGPGVIESRTGSIAVIDFAGSGVRRLDLTACRKGGLLKRAET
ncbi:ATP-dependent helicase [Intestinimonas sp.]|uniref:ATP-dependent helicase n=1 Tax=Intestinimonas sp. TaxID=1965293 RepID=UPI00263A0643|nr:ATP-dependent helicase [Intestinimonas sp.]